jgi:hypothetical protein
MWWDVLNTCILLCLKRNMIQIWAEFLFWPKSQGRENALRCIHPPLPCAECIRKMHFLYVAFLNLGLHAVYFHYNNAQLAVSYNFHEYIIYV